MAHSFHLQSCKIADGNGHLTVEDPKSDKVEFFKNEILKLEVTKAQIETHIAQQKAEAMANEKRCAEVKTKIDPADASILSWSDDCRAIYYDTSNDPTLLKISIENSTTTLSANFVKPLCTQIENNTISPWVLEFFEPNVAIIAQGILRRSFDTSNYERLKNKYAGLKLNWHADRSYRGGGQVRASLGPGNSAANVYRLLDENDYARLNKNKFVADYATDKAKLENLKLVLRLNVPGLRTKDGAVFIGQSASMQLHISTIGYCYFTRNGDLDFESEGALEKLESVIELTQ